MKFRQRCILSLCMAVASTSVLAADWEFLPVGNANYKPDLTLSLAAGTMNGTPAGSGSAESVELAFNCILLQPPTGQIRSKISWNSFDHHGLKLSTLEVNPRWTLNLDKNLSWGIGPGVGYVRADLNGRSTSMAALQLGTDLDYRIGALNLGLGARWQDTKNKVLANGSRGANNTMLQAKVGFTF